MAIFDVRSRRPLPGSFQAQDGRQRPRAQPRRVAAGRRPPAGGQVQQGARSSSGTSAARHCGTSCRPASPTAGSASPPTGGPWSPSPSRTPSPARPGRPVPLGRRHRQAAGRAGHRLHPGRRRLGRHPQRRAPGGRQRRRGRPGRPGDPAASPPPCPASRSRRGPMFGRAEPERPNGRARRRGWDGPAPGPADRTASTAEGKHESHIGGVAFSADGTMLATGGADRRVIVRDVASGQVHETFQGGEGPVRRPRASAPTGARSTPPPPGA